MGTCGRGDSGFTGTQGLHLLHARAADVIQRRKECLCSQAQCCGDKIPQEGKRKKDISPGLGIILGDCPNCRPVNKQGMVVGYVSQYKAAQGMVARKPRKGEEER